MRKRVLTLIVLQWILCPYFSDAQDGSGGAEADEVVVTASRIPVEFSEITRSVVVIGKEELQQMPVRSLQDVLSFVHGVDIRERGPRGVQADVSMRGGTFEQTLILVNGVKMTDPQTGHHHLNLPLNLDDIERIEILKGPGSRLFGPNAFDGVINIITRAPSRSTVAVYGYYGEYDYLDVGISASYSSSEIHHSLSLSKRQSSGYRYNTDFDILTAAYTAGVGTAKLYTGFIDKKFGANGFYSERFPDQWEHTRTFVANASKDWQYGGTSLSTKVYWRMNEDEFLLVRRDPSFYRNFHTTHTYGAEFQTMVHTTVGVTAVGAEVGRDDITSTNLGDHSRNRGGVFVEHQLEPARNLFLILGAFAYGYSGWGWDIWPGFEAGYRISPVLRVYGSVGKSFRVPTYTELYYEDPANRGNAELKPEEVTSYEVGGVIKLSSLTVNLSGFHRSGSNLIDWVRTGTDDPWTARNITQVNTWGVEFSVEVPTVVFDERFPIRHFLFSYSYIGSDLKSSPEFQSGYVLDHLTHQAIVNVRHSLPFRFFMGWVIRYEKRREREGYLLVDARLMRTFASFDITIDGSNLLGTEYYTLRSVPMPGRWVRAGVTWSFQ